MLLVVAFVYLMLAERGTNFYFDDWAWIEARHGGLHPIFASYNQHLVIAPVALYQLLFRTAGLNHYWVFRTLQTLAHLSCVAVVFEFVRRRLGAVALLVAIPLAFLGSGWEYVTLSINFGCVTSIALSVGALLALERDDRRGDVLACVLLVVALACSDFTVPFALGIAVEIMLRDGVVRGRSGVHRLRALRHRAFVWATPLVLYAAWWVAFYTPSASHRASISAAIPFAAKLAAAAAGSVVGGGLYLGAVTGNRGSRSPVANRPRAHDHAPPGRAADRGDLVLAACRLRPRPGGVPETSRYVYAGVVFLILIAAEAFREIRLGPGAIAIASLVALFLLSQGFDHLRDRNQLPALHGPSHLR